MNYYFFAPLITSILVILWGFFVWYKNKTSNINKVFLWFSITGFWWQFWWIFLFNTKNQTLAYYISKIGYSGIIFIPIAYLHFVISFLNIKKIFLIKIFYLIGFLLLISIWTTHHFVEDVYQYYFGFYPKVGLLHIIHILQVFICAILGFYFLSTFLKKEKKQSIKYNQIKYLILAAGFYCFCATDYFVNYGVKFYPLGFIFEILSYVVFGYTTIKYHLMDINVAIKKTTLLGLRAGVPAGVYVFLVTTFQNNIKKIHRRYY